MDEKLKTDNPDKLLQALQEAIFIIEQYRLDIENSYGTIGIDLVKESFCQGHYYKDAFSRIGRKLGSNKDISEYLDFFP